MKYWYLVAPAFGALVMLSAVWSIAQAGFACWLCGALSAFFAMTAMQRYALEQQRELVLRVVDGKGWE